jgi:hypothetical protein
MGVIIKQARAATRPPKVLNKSRSGTKNRQYQQCFGWPLGHLRSMHRFDDARTSESMICENLEPSLPSRAADHRNEPDISCSEVLFCIDPLKDQSAATFIIKNPHEKPFCIQISKSVSDDVMSVCFQNHFLVDDPDRAAPLFPQEVTSICLVLHAGQCASCTVTLFHAGVKSPSHFLSYYFTSEPHGQGSQQIAILLSSVFALQFFSWAILLLKFVACSSTMMMSVIIFPTRIKYPC